MDPGGAGALIGIGAMLFIFLGIKIRDIYLNRKRKILTKKIHHTPEAKKPLNPVVINHTKINKILPPAKRIILKNLGGSRSLKI